MKIWKQLLVVAIHTAAGGAFAPCLAQKALAAEDSSGIQFSARLEAGLIAVDIGSEEGSAQPYNAFDISVLYGGDESLRWGLICAMGGRVSVFGIDAGAAGEQAWGVASGPSDVGLTGDVLVRVRRVAAGAGIEKRLINRRDLGELDLWGLRALIRAELGPRRQWRLVLWRTGYFTGNLSPQDGRGLASLESGSEIAGSVEHIFGNHMQVGLFYGRTRSEHEPLRYNQDGRLDHGSDHVSLGLGYVFR